MTYYTMTGPIGGAARGLVGSGVFVCVKNLVSVGIAIYSKNETVNCQEPSVRKDIRYGVMRKIHHYSNK